MWWSPGAVARPVDCPISASAGTDAAVRSRYASGRTATALELERPPVVEHLEAALPTELFQLPVVGADAHLGQHLLVHRDRHPRADPAQVVDRVGQLQTRRPRLHGPQLARAPPAASAA